MPLVCAIIDDIDFLKYLYGQLSVATNNFLIHFVIKSVAVVSVDNLVQVAPQYLIRNLQIILRERSAKYFRQVSRVRDLCCGIKRRLVSQIEIYGSIAEHHTGTGCDVIQFVCVGSCQCR